MSNKKPFIDFPKLLFRVWLILWAILGILLIMKFCFNMWYPIVVNNPMFLKIFDYIDNHKWLECLIGCIFYTFSTNIFILTNISKYKYPKIIIAIILNIFIIGIFLLKYFVNMTIANILEIFCIVIFPIVFNLITKNFKNKKIDVLLPICLYILCNLFDLNILLIRGIQDILTNLSATFYLTMQLDYYIFLVILWMGVNSWAGLHLDGSSEKNLQS